MSEPYIIHTVGVGDTIQSIGAYYGVDWTEIVTMNGLQYPYIDDEIINNDFSYVDTVAKIGSKLIIPGSFGEIPVKSNNSSEELEKYAFGQDLDLFSPVLSTHLTANLEDTGYLTDDGNGDIRRCEGLDNLRQQLIIRLGTPKGALILHPEFGSDILSFIGRKVNPELLVEIQLEVQECLLGDFRVMGVSDITTVFKDKSVRVECMVHPIEPYSSPFLLGYTYTA